MSLPKEELTLYVVRQLNNNFYDKAIDIKDISDYMDTAIQRVEYCFSRVNNKYFFDGSSSVFNHLHGDQYCMFLYYLSNTIYKKNGDINICSKLFLLNKMLHGLDAFYEISLPDIFLVVHPLATVLGRGVYSDYFVVYQRCGIGSNHNVYPQLGKHVTMHPGSSVLGNSTIGNNCKIAAESLIIDRSLEDNMLYIGNPKQHTLKTNYQHSSFWFE